MTAIELLRNTKDLMNERMAPLDLTMVGLSDLTLTCGRAALRALLAYADPYDTDTPDDCLFGRIRSFCRMASHDTQIDAVDYAIELLGGQKC